jgi:phage terminase small subunit
MARAGALRADVPEYGAAMMALPNDRMREFVTQYVLTGNASLAAKLAGYKQGEGVDNGYAKQAWQLKQRDCVRAAIEEETRRYLRVLGPPAVSWLSRIITGADTKDADRLRAIDMVLTRVDPIISGQVVQVNHDHRHRVQLSADQITARILELAGRVGVDVAALPSPPVIEAVAEVVE